MNDQGERRPEKDPEAPPVLQRKGSFARTVRAVAWSLIGLRKGSEYQQDLQKINPLHVIVVGLGAIFLLVLGLIAVVNWVVN